MKTVIIIGDGMADRPLKELNYLNPLGVSWLKSMDRLASSGISGLLYPISPGVVPGSDMANLALLGYDPYKVYTGRAPITISSAEVIRDGVSRYTERAIYRGGLGHIHGRHIMPILLDFGRVEKLGA